jgi:thiol peroxidase
MNERKGLITFAGKEMTVVGENLLPGDTAPTFVAHNQDYESVDVLETTRGKVRIIATLLSLATSVCDRETKHFNEEAAKLDKDIAIIIISADLPSSQKNWCGATGVDQVIVVSDHEEMDFGAKYGCLVKEMRVLRRAAFVVDRSGIIRYAAYMPAFGIEPDYAAVLEAAKKAL